MCPEGREPLADREVDVFLELSCFFHDPADVGNLVLDKTLESPWTARRSNQSILKEINLKYSLEGLTLKLKPQYFGHLMQRDDSLEKTLIDRRVDSPSLSARGSRPSGRTSG